MPPHTQGNTRSTNREPSQSHERMHYTSVEEPSEAGYSADAANAVLDQIIHLVQQGPTVVASAIKLVYQ